jgi:hypothetical protein
MGEDANSRANAADTRSATNAARKLELIASGEVSRCVISRDGSAWVGRTYGTYMPVEGAEARGSRLEGLKDEAQGQARVACLQATGGYLSSSSWSYEYALGESTDGKLEAFRQLSAVSVAL